MLKIRCKLRRAREMTTDGPLGNAASVLHSDNHEDGHDVIEDSYKGLQMSHQW